MDHVKPVTLNLPEVRILSTQRIEPGTGSSASRAPWKGSGVAAAGGRFATCMGGMRSYACAIYPCSSCPSSSKFGPNGSAAPPVQATPRQRHGKHGTSRAAPT
jgi:hypothetical protein